MRWPDRRPDAGMSLVETIVAMAIGSIVLAGVGTVFVGAINTTRRVAVTTSLSADSRIAMEEVSREIRVAVKPDGIAAALTLAKANTVSFYALLNRTGGSATTDVAPTLISYVWNGTCLNVVKTPGTAISGATSPGPYYTWTTGATTKCLLRTSVAPTFAYYTTSAITLSGSDVAAMTLPASGLVTTDLALVESIQVTITAKDAANPSVPAVVVLNRITLNNIVSSLGGS